VQAAEKWKMFGLFRISIRFSIEWKNCFEFRFDFWDESFISNFETIFDISSNLSKFRYVRNFWFEMHVLTVLTCVLKFEPVQKRCIAIRNTCFREFLFFLYTYWFGAQNCICMIWYYFKTCWCLADSFASMLL
jgi:hypothetical protein